MTSGLAKAYGLPGLRIGWIVGPPLTNGVVVVVSTITRPSLRAPSTIALARRALEPATRERLLARTRAILNRNYPIVATWLDAQDGWFTYAPPDAGAIVYIALSARYQFDRFDHQTPCRERRAHRSRRHFSDGRFSAPRIRRQGATVAWRTRSTRRGPHRFRIAGCRLRTFDLLLVGYGNVARRLVTLLDEQRARLARDHDLSVRIVGIATGGTDPPMGRAP